MTISKTEIKKIKVVNFTLFIMAILLDYNKISDGSDYLPLFYNIGLYQMSNCFLVNLLRGGAEGRALPFFTLLVTFPPLFLVK
jgi:hypothetical protein